MLMFSSGILLLALQVAGGGPPQQVDPATRLVCDEIARARSAIHARCPAAKIDALLTAAVRHAFPDAAIAAAVEQFATDIDPWLGNPVDRPNTIAMAYSLARLWRAAGRPREALAIAERLAATHPDIADCVRGTVACDEGRTQDAIAALQQARSSKQETLATHASLQLIALYERQGDWRHALELYRSWHPPADQDCGNCAQAHAARWELNMARCRFLIGEQEAALAAIWAMMLDASVFPHTAELAMDVGVELAVQKGQLEQLRARRSELHDAGRRELLQARLDLAQCFVAGELVAVVHRVMADPELEPLAVGLLRHHRGDVDLSRWSGSNDTDGAFVKAGVAIVAKAHRTDAASQIEHMLEHETRAEVARALTLALIRLRQRED